VKAEIILEKESKSYFVSKDILTPEQWRVLICRQAERVLAKNGWKVKRVNVES
jgi:hypothetical protein